MWVFEKATEQIEPLILADFPSFVGVQESVLDQLPLLIQVGDTWLAEGVK